MINWNANTLDVFLWDVGHGLSVTIITPYVLAASGIPMGRRRVVQVDAGSNSETNFYPSFHMVDARKMSTIDCLILTHPDMDHISDLPVVDALMQRQTGGLTIHTLLRNKAIPLNEISEDQSEESQAKKVYRKLHNHYNGDCPPHHKLVSTNFGGVSFTTAMLPYAEGRSVNDMSVVVSVLFGNTQIIIPGDLESSGVNELIRLGQMPVCANVFHRILIAPHHGRESAEPVDLLNFYKPSIVLASAKEEDEFTDSIYSNAKYVRGHSVTSSAGEITHNCRFNATKGEAIHVEVDPQFETYPFIRRVAYKSPQR